MRIGLLSLFAILLFVADGAARQRASLSSDVMQYVGVSDPVVALTGLQLVDGTGSPARPGQTVVIRDDRIVAVGPDGTVEIPDGARVLSLAGQTAIPGLIGLHNHTYYTTSRRSQQLNFSAPRLYLGAGVTTIRTTGSYAPYSELNLKRAIDDGDIPGPRMFVTGPYITGGSGMSQMTRLSGPDDARRVVRYWAEEGVSWFKAYTQISRAELAAAIEEAHKHGIKVTGHLCSISFREAVALGIDNLEHGFFTNTDYYEGKQPDECPSGFRAQLADVDLEGEAVQQTFRDMISHNVPMTSTLAVYEMFIPGRPPLEDRVLEAMSPEVREEFLTTREQIAGRENDEDYVFNEALLAKAIAYEYAFMKAGGTLASGVDPTGYGGALPGYGDQRNYELLLEGAFTPEEAIQVLSANGARVLGIYDDVGTIEVGKLADIVIIDGDPVARPAEIRNVKWVFKSGVGYDASTLIEAVKGAVGVR